MEILVTLQPGFEAQAGSIFKAYIGGCGIILGSDLPSAPPLLNYCRCFRGTFHSIEKFNHFIKKPNLQVFEVLFDFLSQILVKIHFKNDKLDVVNCLLPTTYHLLRETFNIFYVEHFGLFRNKGGYLKAVNLTTMGKIIAIANQKGGRQNYHGHQLAASLAVLDFKTLIVDADPQANSTSGLGFNPKEIEYSIYECMVEGVIPQEAIVETNFEKSVPFTFSH